MQESYDGAKMKTKKPSITPLEFFATKSGHFHCVRLLTHARPKSGVGTLNPVFKWKLKSKEEILKGLQEIGWEEKWCSNWSSFERWRDDLRN